ncbi:transcriptional repressor [Moorellaceae bacterium AZ2]|nr:transcriptional repressor [Thermoanaerobacteraceae bacterium]
MAVGMRENLERLQEHERRLTPQRKAVLQAFLELSQEHPTADEIYRAAKNHCATLGLATVYRTLDLFVQLGIIQKVPSVDGIARYEVNSLSHSHFLCLKCGRTYELEEEGVNLPVPQRLSTSGFEILKCSLVVVGFCPSCRRSI